MKPEPNTSSASKRDISIDVKVSDLTLTPLSCASLVAEIFKALLYEKSQIPYTYNWMKTVIDKKRCKDNQGASTNFQIQKYFRTVSSTYETLESVIKSLGNEFRSPVGLKEIVFVLGVTPLCPKEIFSVKILSLAAGHAESNHLLESSRKLHKVLRDIFLSEVWMNSGTPAISCTNTYVFVKKSRNEETMQDGNSVFIPAKPLHFSNHVKHTVINLSYEQLQESSCCSNLTVFSDDNGSPDKKLKTDFVVSDCDDNGEFWYQAKVPIQGFKDSFINHVSICELW